MFIYLTNSAQFIIVYSIQTNTTLLWIMVKDVMGILCLKMPLHETLL